MIVQQQRSAASKLAAIILAAGSGSRMGHRPKCLLELDGEPLIRRQIIALAAAGVAELLVVVGHYSHSIESALEGLPVNIVLNAKPDDGQTSSLKLGLQALPAGIDTVLVALADQPLIEVQDISDLLAAYHLRPAGVQVVQPEVKGQPGNPVVFTAQVREAILAGHANFGCKQWQTAHPAAVLRWPSLNPHYCMDVDTEQDVLAFTERTGRHLRWAMSA
jgi:molybdenum cofactor cytidylyltransferase